MSYDLFISYSRRDNERGQVAALKTGIESTFRSFAGHDLTAFFDVQDIQGMDDWRQKIQQNLRDSRLFLAVLSPNYLSSPYCQWEWDDYVRYEAMRQCLGEGVAPIFFVTLPDSSREESDQALADWMSDIRRRQIFDLRPWHDAGEKALLQTHVKSTLEQLNASVRDRLDRFERGRRSPDNLIRHNPAFVGRVRELTELRNALMRSTLGVIGAREGHAAGRATVQGLGGMGKTELALAYAHAFAWDYPGGRWQIRCEHIGDLRQALLQLAGPLRFEFTEDENKSPALAFERVLRELSERERCLLVLDNVSDANILEPEHLDRLPHDGRLDVIATTRLAPRNLPGSAQAQTFITVDELPEEDALSLLRSHQPQGRFPNQEEDNHGREIVRLLEGFTLAVETAAIYLGRYAGEVTCQQFLGDLRARLLHSEEIAADATVAVRHRERLLERTLAFTLATLPPEALHLLHLASLLPADAIAVPWLQAVGAERFVHFSDASDLPTAAFLKTEDLLLGLRLVQTGGLDGSDGRPLVVRMHRLVQEIVAQRDGLPGTPLLDKLVHHAKERCQFLEANWLEWTNRWEIDPLRAFSEALLALTHPEASLVARSVGSRLGDLARYAEAERLSRLALAVDEQMLGPDHPTVSTDINGLAALLWATNRMSEAEALLYRALAIDVHGLGGGTAANIANLAQLLQDTNRFAEAEPLLRRAVEAYEKALGSDHPTVATCLNNLAQTLKATNRLTEAEALHRRALSIDERHFGPDHPTVGRDLNNLGHLLLVANRLTEAEPLLRRALAIDENSLGPDHPNVAVRLDNLAQVLRLTSRPAEAEPLQRRALDIDERNFGPHHPSVAADLNNLAMLLDNDRPEEAETLYRRALAIDEQSLGAFHTSVGRDLNNLASLLFSTNRASEAEPLFRRALTIYEKTLGPDHPEIATYLNNLALLLHTDGRIPEAVPLWQRALQILEGSFGPNHPDVSASLNNLGNVLLSAGRLSEAEPMLRRALAINEQNLGAEHADIVPYLMNLAQVLVKTNRRAEAEPLVRRILKIRERTLGPGHP